MEKWQGFGEPMHQNGQNRVKTSELEDQYAVIFSLSLWSEEPREIDFFKRVGFHNNNKQTKYNNRQS